MDSKSTARILEIQRMSTDDGPGIRTTVFFKGCSLKCAWCHNPESISMKPQVHWVGSNCLGCKTCIESCPQNALSFTESGIEINRSTCISCGTCAEECPAAAIELLGKEWTIDELTNEVIKDKAFFETSGGGVTISGGEPGMQAEFIGSFLKSLREKGIHTAVDTCGLCSRKALEQLLPYASMILYDVKEIQTDKHKQFTGENNHKILENLLYVAEYMRSHVYPTTLWIRTPMIPDMTAREDNVFMIGRYIAKNLGDIVNRWELCAFNNLCKDKYLRLGKPWGLENTKLIQKKTMNQLSQLAKASGINPDIVSWSGATRLESETV